MFLHADASVDSADFEGDVEELKVIAHLTKFADDPLSWQSEALDAWNDMVMVTGVYNERNPNKPIMPRQHFLKVFEYLAMQEDTFLTPYKLNMGKEDKKKTIQSQMLQAEANLDQQEGIVQLALEVWQFIVPGSGPTVRLEGEVNPKIVHQGAQILRYEQRLLDTTLAEADYGELIDVQ